MAADIAFAIDSIPAAFAITRDSVLIWMANIFALLGLRALFVLVEGLIRRFRYLDETIAIVLAIVAVKLLVEDLYKVGPVMTLVVVFVAFAIGIVASIIADRATPTPRPSARSAPRRWRARAPAPDPPSRRTRVSWRSTSASTSSGGCALRLAAGVAGDHELAHLLAQRGVDGRRGQAGELVLDVDLGLAAGGVAGVARLEHLADLVVALAEVDGAARSGRAGWISRSSPIPPRPISSYVLPRKNSETSASTAEIATTAKMTMPNASSIVHHGPMWRRVRRRTMAPRRPLLFPRPVRARARDRRSCSWARLALVLWACLG